MVPIEDHGMTIKLPSGSELRCIPSHFMHSPGNFSLFDSRSRILFTADIGAAVFDDGTETVFVEDFRKHLPLIEGFHTRYLASNSVARRWCTQVTRLNPAMLAPQHGAIYKDAAVKDFLAWLSELRCGVDLLDQFYGA